ncbi:3' terminal RNA ribose 2'-O-methyltransferase Hen1 [Embleya scabrispora]|uniref:3' terminal RNA ribose 2'-O-methyltransferase Hen1 n=1 Tax=Embleya scabrispora TaxID=159449 RepID=UPI000366C567|nr:3' terminal RNA ribose 2'-O-methyltransferase Hen1 [Embleya scabrispora]MYS85900.1 3' terminal RNA ribose 2'-O-methyltransferase Hen1 [Streptomyces sp. SID5474]
MFLTIATTHQPATDLGFLLHKHPGKAQRFSTTYGEAHVFYPEANDARCTAALLLDVDPIALTRGVKRGKGAKGSPDLALAQYVNDRPYAASSLLAVALGTVFRTAMQGRCDARPELAALPMPLEIEVPALPARGGEEMVRRLFEPLGCHVAIESIPLDSRFPTWGESRYVRLALSGTVLLADALRQLYVLLPVLDNAKHYWVAPDEVDKLLRAGEGWLSAHPDRDLIASRYLSRRPTLTRSAMERLAEVDETAPENLDNAIPDDAGEDAEAGEDSGAVAVAVAGVVSGVPPEGADAGVEVTPAAAGVLAGVGPVSVVGAVATEGVAPAGVAAVPTAAVPAIAVLANAPATGDVGVAGEGAGADERPPTLARQRRDAILAALRAAGAERVLDLGCGDGKLIGALLREPRFREIVGVDVSTRALTIAERKLKLARMSERQRDRVRLIQGALTYTDKRLVGYDAAVLCEVIEHLDEPRLPALEYAVLGSARPATVVVTTPNVEYNVRYAPEEEGGEGLAAGAMRHGDHRFEWDRATFRAWAERAAAKYGYATRFEPVGEIDPEVGPSTQMVVFTRTETDVAGIPHARDTPALALTPTANDEGTGATA